MSRNLSTQCFLADLLITAFTIAYFLYTACRVIHEKRGPQGLQLAMTMRRDASTGSGDSWKRWALASVKEWSLTIVFWPRDLLGKDFPNLRVLTYGYDSHILLRKGPVNQLNLYDHARGLLHDLMSCRENDPSKPLIFVVHSLGGILLKDILRRCWAAQSYQPKERKIYDSTKAIISWTIRTVDLGTHPGDQLWQILLQPQVWTRTINFSPH